MEENNFVIRSSIYKLVSMLLLHPILVARNVKNYFKTNKKINLKLQSGQKDLIYNPSWESLEHWSKTYIMPSAIQDISFHWPSQNTGLTLHHIKITSAGPGNYVLATLEVCKIIQKGPLLLEPGQFKQHNPKQPQALSIHHQAHQCSSAEPILK